MKKIKMPGLMIVITILFISCGPSLKVSSDFDKAANFSTYKTFRMLEHQTKGNVSELNANRIYNAIRSQMIAKGFVELADNADLLVNAITMLKDEQQVTANTSAYGYGGAYRPYGYWGGGMVSGTTTYSTYDYKTGTFTIDVVDAKTNKLVWQGVGSAEIDKKPKDPEEKINNGVAKIMASFPPGAKK